MKKALAMTIILLLGGYAYAQEAILKPAAGTVFKQGDNIEVDFEFPQAQTIEGALFTFSNGKMGNAKAPGPYRISFLAGNDRTIGKLEITAMTYGTGQNYMAETYIMIEPKEPFVRISSPVDTLRMEQLGLSLQVNAIGYYADGSSVNLTRATTGTIYSVQSGTNNVISVNPNGLVRAIAEGKDAVVITNRGQSVTVPVEVRVAPPAR